MICCPWTAWERDGQLSMNTHLSLLLTGDTKWPAASVSRCHDFLTMMDFVIRAKTNPSFLKWPRVRYFNTTDTLWWKLQPSGLLVIAVRKQTRKRPQSNSSLYRDAADDLRLPQPPLIRSLCLPMVLNQRPSLQRTAHRSHSKSEVHQLPSAGSHISQLEGQPCEDQVFAAMPLQSVAQNQFRRMFG